MGILKLKALPPTWAMAENRGVKKINTKRKFVADGVFQAELNEFLQKTLGMEGYAGIEIRATSVNTEIRVRAAKCTELLQKQTRKVKEIKALIEKRYQFNDNDNKVDLAIKPVPYDRNLCAAANVETLKYSSSREPPSVWLPTTSSEPSCVVVAPSVAKLWSPVRSVASAQRPRSTLRVTRSPPVSPSTISSMLPSVPSSSVRVFLVSRSRSCRALRSRWAPSRRSCQISSRLPSPRTKTTTTRVPLLSPPSSRMTVVLPPRAPLSE